MTQPVEQSQEVWLTPEAYDKLRAELEDLKGRVRSELSRRIGAVAATKATSARAAGYEAPRRSRARSRPASGSSQRHARTRAVGEARTHGRVEPGMQVTVTLRWWIRPD